MTLTLAQCLSLTLSQHLAQQYPTLTLILVQCLSLTLVQYLYLTLAQCLSLTLHPHSHDKQPAAHARVDISELSQGVRRVSVQVVPR